jgi:hypothetical protein
MRTVVQRIINPTRRTAMEHTEVTTAVAAQSEVEVSAAIAAQSEVGVATAVAAQSEVVAQVDEAPEAELRTYKVWLSAESTINTTLEVEATSHEEALEKAQDYAEDSATKHLLQWYYEGSGDLLLDEASIWPVDLLPKPLSPHEALQQRITGLFATNNATTLLFIRHGRDLRVCAGGRDVTTSIATALRLPTNYDARSGVTTLAKGSPANIIQRINELLGRIVEWDLIG